MRLGGAAQLAAELRPAVLDLSEGNSARDSASAGLAIAGLLIGVLALAVIFRADDPARRRPAGAMQRRTALVLFVLAGVALAIGIFLASL